MLQNEWIERVLIPSLEAGDKAYMGNIRYYLNPETKDIIFEKMVNNEWVKIT